MQEVWLEVCEWITIFFYLPVAVCDPVLKHKQSAISLVRYCNYFLFQYKGLFQILRIQCQLSGSSTSGRNCFDAFK